MVRIAGRLVVVWAGLIVAEAALGQVDSAPGGSSQTVVVETPGLQATQVSVVVDRDGSRRRFRATVLQVDGDELTIFTAAHCLSEDDEGWPVSLLVGERMGVEGVVGPVVRNPKYRPNLPKEIPGPDNAVARLRFRVGPDARPVPPRAERTAAGRPVLDPLARVLPTRDPLAIAAFRAIRPAPALTTRFYPGPHGDAVNVRMIDGRRVEHAVRAGNYSNPIWLEWGRSYQPIPGDSGGGVFVIAPGPTKVPRPILIGIIVGRDDRGGGASLISLGEPWVANAIKRPQGGS